MPPCQAILLIPLTLASETIFFSLGRVYKTFECCMALRKPKTNIFIFKRLDH